jgi:sulfoxide reductase catalytic subunit YedY
MSKSRWQDYPQVASSEITPESVWLDRRNLIKVATVSAGLAMTGETLAQPIEPKALPFSPAADGTAFKAIEI